MLKISTVPHQWHETKLKTLITNAPASPGKKYEALALHFFFLNTVRHL
jgi:hypothetical protein